MYPIYRDLSSRHSLATARRLGSAVEGGVRPPGGGVACEGLRSARGILEPREGRPPRQHRARASRRRDRARRRARDRAEARRAGGARARERPGAGPAAAARRRRADPDPDDRATRTTPTRSPCCATRAAHLLAEAVRRLYPGVKIAIGPPIENGFYYDFEFPEPIDEEDLERIEAEVGASSPRAASGRARRSRPTRPARASRPRASRTRSSSSTPRKGRSRSTPRASSPTSAAARTCRTRSRSRRSS